MVLVRLLTDYCLYWKVSTEAPYFKTSTLDQEMKVIDPPDAGPTLVGGQISGYRVGDLLNINCSSPPSYPPALLRFYVNEQMVRQVKVRRQESRLRSS